MKYGFCIVFLLIMVCHQTFSQKDSIRIARNLLYIEAGGAGGYGSINYERVLFNKKYFIYSIRLGASTCNIRDYENNFNPDIIVPISINVYFGKRHKIGFGIGETFANIIHAGIIDLKPQRITTFHTGFSVGYRYQKNSGGMVFSCSYTPIIEFNSHFRNWAGISFGYSF